MSGEQFWPGGVAVEVGALVSVGLVVSGGLVVSVGLVASVLLIVPVVLDGEPPVTKQEQADETREGILWH